VFNLVLKRPPQGCPRIEWVFQEKLGCLWVERVFRDRTSTFFVVSGGVLWIDMDDPVRLSWAPVQEIPVGPPRQK
jgi:hypothetical protein